ncbi:MAG: chemotaxis protein CheW [Candidatus Helarchaeota archaeon]|nr:chemotaxis protein CheW [Candidatus Helarchaeota archaeon]
MPLTSEEINDLEKEKDNKFYKIYVKIQSTCVFKKVRLFIIFRALNQIGRIVYSSPEPDLLEMGQFDFDFELFFITKEEKTEVLKKLEEILEIENKSITEITINDIQKMVDATKLQKVSKVPKAKIPIKEHPKIESPVSVPDMGETFERDETTEEQTESKITVVKVDIPVLERLMNLFGELIIVKNQVNQILKERQIWEVNRLFGNMDKLFLEIQEIVYQLKLVKVGSVFTRYRRMVRDLAKEQGKEIQFLLEGMDVEIDRKVLEDLSSAIIHLLRNAVHHGIESPETRKKYGKDPEGIISLRAYRQAGAVIIEIEDNGKGLDYDAIRTKLVEKETFSQEEADKLTEDDLKKEILKPGFTTLPDADMTSGRGMGLAIVVDKIIELSGALMIDSKPGLGMKTTLTVPFTRAILRAQLIKVAGDLFAIPLENINQIYFFDNKLIEYVKGVEFYRIESKLVPIIRLDKQFDLNSPVSEEKVLNNESKIALWCKKDEEKSAVLIADNVIQQLEIVVKPFRSKYSRLKGISGVTITGDGAICLIIDILELLSGQNRNVQENLISESIQDI